MQTEQPASGVLQINEKGFGFLRHPESNYLPSPKDVFVPRGLIQHFRLREGVQLSGTASASDNGAGGQGGRGGRGRPQSDQMTTIDLINGIDPDQYVRIPEFTKLTSVDPTERLELSAGNPNLSMRVLDLIAPIGKGQRGLIVAPPKTGKTTLIEEIAEAVADNHPETHLVVLLVDERPEEVTHMKRRVRGEVIASSSDQNSEFHLQITHLVHERVKRMVECKQDVVMLLDSITRLARASNRETSRRGRTMSGGVDSRALEFPRKFFGAARKAEEGGSLTIIGTALIDTGSQMDEVIFQEFKGTGNLEIQLDRKLAERRIFPAIDISKSGTRKEEKLFDADTMPQINLLRRALAGKKSIEAMEMLLKGLSETRDNREFLDRLKQTGT
jgi:transcription termination factor Rho